MDKVNKFLEILHLKQIKMYLVKRLLSYLNILKRKLKVYIIWCNSLQLMVYKQSKLFQREIIKQEFLLLKPLILNFLIAKSPATLLMYPFILLLLNITPHNFKQINQIISIWHFQAIINQKYLNN